MGEHSRVSAHQITLTDPHVDVARLLRQQFQQPSPSLTEDQLGHDLADYDPAFGVQSGRSLMTAKQQPPWETVKQIHYLAAALKAPRITAAAARLADQADDEE